MSMRSFVLFAVALAVAPSTALADRPSQYFALQMGSYDLEWGGGAEDDGELVRLKYGLDLSRFLAIEAHYGMDIDGGKNPHLAEGALFGRFNLPYERVDVYALAGVGRAGADLGDGRESDTGPALGLGIDLYGSERSAITLEFLRYELDDDDDPVYKAVTLGWTHHFEWPAFRP